MSDQSSVRPAHSPPDATPRPNLWQSLRSRPLIPVAISLTSGIVWADVVTPSPLHVAALAGVVIAIVLLEVLLKWESHGVFICLAAALVGASLHAQRLQPGPDDPAGLYEQPAMRMRATVTHVLKATPYFQRVQLLASAAQNASGPVRVRGRIVMSIPGEPVVSPGDEVLLREVTVWHPYGPTSPGQFDLRKTMARQGVHAVGKAGSVAVTAPSPALRSTLDGVVATMRRHVVSVLRAAMPGDDDLYADLLAGMVFGMYNVQLPDEIIEAFRRSGTLHMMVVSGAHVSLLAGAIIILATGRRVKLPLWAVLLVAIPLIIYALVAGVRASVARSLAMVMLSLVALATGRNYDFPSAISLAAIILCIADTSSPFSVGTQLTFAAVVGVIVFIPRSRAGESRLRANARSAVGAAFGAWAMTVPIIAWHFNTLLLIGSLANIAVTPMRVALLPIGFIAVMLGTIWLPLAVVPCAIGRALTALTLWIVQAFASTPGAALDVFHMPAIGVFAWYLAVLVVWWCLQTPHSTESALPSANNRSRRIVCTALCCAGWLVVVLVALPVSRQPLRITMLAVGQGQCMLITDGAEHTVMIDAGSGTSSAYRYRGIAQRVIVPYLAHRGIRHLDALLMTHGDADHCNAIPDIIKSVRVDRIITNGLCTPDRTDATNALAAARNAGVDCLTFRAGSKIELGDGVVLEALYPPDLPNAVLGADRNDTSVVTRLEASRTSVFLPGDIEAGAELQLVQMAQVNGANLRSTVLVLPHHGRKTSSSAVLLDAVRPQLAIVSGASRGGRPAYPAVAKRLRDRHIPLVSTDLLGTVDVYLQGDRIRIECAADDYWREAS